MDEELKAKWVAALRSGEYKQARGEMLSSDGGMCCLGVLERICGTPVETIAKYNYDITITKPGVDRNSPDQSDWELRDIPIDVRNTLADLNDGRSGKREHSFAEIADYIEANL